MIVNIFKSKRYVYATLIIFLLLIFASTVLPYSVTAPNRVIHQHITKEATKVWKLIPYEIKNHINSNISAPLDNYGYQSGEDAIIGSGEEDTDLFTDFLFPTPPFQFHFWQPDNPQNGNYNDGLDVTVLRNRESSYTRAKTIWVDKVIPLYLKGEINESYYWLGRVAHLLEDASQPSHVLLDCHVGSEPFSFICNSSVGDGGADDSVLEEYTSNNFTKFQNTYNWSGENFIGQQYNYEDLPNIQNFNWKEVDPNRPLDKQNIELFRLFWYTAQKTQYFASDDANGNNFYYNLTNNQKFFTTSLWTGDGITIVNISADLTDDDVGNTGPDIEKETNAMIPHAMKATAGLYRLFWDTVHSYNWPTYHHDNRRTGFTLLKGDTTSTSKKKGMNLVLSSGIATDALARPSIANIDNDEMQDVVVSFSKSSTDGWIVGLEKDSIWKTTKERWKKTIGYPVSAAPSLGNIDSEKDLEVVVGLENGTLIVIDPDESKNPPIKWTYTVSPEYSAIYGDNIRGNLGFTAIEDIDLDGKAEIIFTDYQVSLYDWKGELYVLEDNGATYTEEDTIYLTADGDGGAQGAPAIANLDDDDNSEIVIPGYYGIKVYDFTSGSLSEKCSNSHAKIIGAPVIYDIDRDNEYEIIYTTADWTCGQGGCSNKLYIINSTSNPCPTEKTIDLSIYSLVAPAIANLDSDSNLEIVVQGRTTSEGDYDNITVYDANTGTQQWSYGPIQMIDVSPNIADIDGNGNYNIIVAKDSSEVLILNNDGTKYDEFNVEGLIGSSPVIGDLSGKGVAELAVKRAGSPIAVLTTLTGNNSKPALNEIDNITAIAGSLININESGLLSAEDPDGDALIFYYSSPFNESGLWQSTINDTSNYSILIEASDGNLSDYQYVDLMVFSSTTNVTDTFADGETKKSLTFTGGENQTVYVRLPKNANVVYSKIKIQGLAP